MTKLFATKTAKLPHFPIILLGITILITIGTLCWLGLNNYQTSKRLEASEAIDFNAVKLHGTIFHLNEILMMSVHMGVTTGEKKWEDRYNYYRPLLTNAINEAVQLSPRPDIQDTANKTDNANTQLMTMDHEAFELAKKGKQNDAKKILISPSYEMQKKLFNNGMDNYYSMLQQQAQLDLQTQLNNVHYSIIIIITDFILLILAWAITFRSIFIWKKELEQIIISQIEYKKEIESTRHFLHEMLVINKMNDKLQTCQQLQEAYPIINLTAEELFPDLSGGLSMRHTITNDMETVEQWGNFKILKPLYNIYDCWGLRDGNVYIVNDPKKSLPCHHFELAVISSYICIPLLLQDGIIGLFELNAAPGNTITDYQQQLAITFSEVLKLSLGNIKLREKLNSEAVHDPLTGLYNRRYLDATLPRELQHVIRTHGKLCIAMLDIDNFKLINDTRGHEAGDETLRFLGTTLRDNLHNGDIACRYGGEEFIIILLDTGIETAVKRLQQINQIIKENHLYVQNQPLPKITLSIGIAEAPTHGQNVDNLISLADEALYRAKMAGRDRIEIVTKKTE